MLSPVPLCGFLCLVLCGSWLQNMRLEFIGFWGGKYSMVMVMIIVWLLLAVLQNRTSHVIGFLLEEYVNSGYQTML